MTTPQCDFCGRNYPGELTSPLLDDWVIWPKRYDSRTYHPRDYNPTIDDDIQFEPYPLSLVEMDGTIPYLFVCMDHISDGDVEINYILPKQSEEYQYVETKTLVWIKTTTEYEKAVVREFQYNEQKVRLELENGTSSWYPCSEIFRCMQKTCYGEEYPLSVPYGSIEEYLIDQGRVLKPQLQYRDSLIPETLRQRLIKMTTRLEQTCTDYHPGSQEQVLDLIHPSLYCYVKGVSHFQEGGVEEIRPNESEEERYQWLPAEFLLLDHDKVEITSYINGLDRKEVDEESYQTIENMFGYFLPIIKDVIQESKMASIEDIRPGIPLQVIFKAVNYIIQPGQTYQGVWHLEGIPKEQIVATGIYYYDTSENMKDQGLEFRRKMYEEEEEEIIMEYSHDRPPPFDYNRTNVHVGSIETPQGRCVVFPNNHQHKLAGLRNESNRPAVRKIVCFFIVNPFYNLISTQNIPDQRLFRQRKLYADALQRYSLRCIRHEMLPSPIINIIMSFLVTGMTLQEAKDYRLALMRQRKYYKNQYNEELEREVSLCEH